MGTMGRFPADGGDVIASLNIGDEITIRAGAGYPASDIDRTEIVVCVDGFSALTNQGTQLMCSDGLSVTTTGQNFEDFEISEKAQEILDALG